MKALDPYGHPVVVHTLPGRYEEIYRPLLGNPDIDGPSLQMWKQTRIALDFFQKQLPFTRMEFRTTGW